MFLFLNNQKYGTFDRFKDTYTIFEEKGSFWEKTCITVVGR